MKSIESRLSALERSRAEGAPAPDEIWAAQRGLPAPRRARAVAADIRQAMAEMHARTCPPLDA